MKLLFNVQTFDTAADLYRQFEQRRPHERRDIDPRAQHERSATEAVDEQPATPTDATSNQPFQPLTIDSDAELAKPRMNSSSVLLAQGQCVAVISDPPSTSVVGITVDGVEGDAIERQKPK